MENTIYYSPIICYEISYSENSYHITVYLKGHKNSKDSALFCELRNFSEDKTEAETFAKSLAENAAMPIHIPELAEEFLSA